jgi:hypothetical protein
MIRRNTKVRETRKADTSQSGVKHKISISLPCHPRQVEGKTRDGNQCENIATSLAGIRAGGDYLCRLPGCLFKAPVACVTEAESVKTRPLDRCGGSAGKYFCGNKIPPASR